MLASFTVISRASSGFMRTSEAIELSVLNKKMRIDLPLQRVEPRLQQQTLLFFELDLDAQGVPDLDRNARLRWAP